MTEDYKEKSANLSGEDDSFSEEESSRVLPWSNRDDSYNPHDNAESRINDAKRKLQEWRKNQTALQNNLNIQVVTQSIQENDEDTESEAPAEKVKPWNNIPFSEKTKVTATAQLGLRYMLQNNKKPPK